MFLLWQPTRPIAKQCPRCGGATPRVDARTPPPSHLQLVNIAEQQAAIEVVLHYHSRPIKVVICTDSAYVNSGAQGNALKWRANGWVSAQGPVTNVDWWVHLMDLLDRVTLVVDWIKVPSHVDILGSDRADSLVEQGCRASPLYFTVKHPVALPQTPLCSPEA